MPSIAERRRAERSISPPKLDVISKMYDSIAAVFFNERLKVDSHFEEFVWPVFNHYLGNIAGQNVVDLGCGPGVVAQKLGAKGAHVFGIDLSHSMLDIAHRNFDKKNGHLAISSRFFLGKAWELPLGNEGADLVVASYVLNHVGPEDLLATLRESNRVLKDGGRVLIMDPHPDRNQLYYQAGGGTESYYPSGWYREGWPELGENLIPVYYRHEEDWIQACQDAGFKTAAMYSPTSHSHPVPGISDEIEKHYAANRILILDLVK